MTGKQMKFLISGGLIVVALVVWFAFVTGGASTSQAAYDISLKEFRARSTQDSDDVRVRGKVEEGSIVQKPGSAELSFTLADEGEVLPVRYSTKDHGPIPDTFVDGANAIVTGSLDDSGTFHAHTLQAKCPSKYEGAEGAEGAKAQASPYPKAPTAGSAQPAAESTQRPAGSTQPPAGSTQPPAGSTQPPAGSTQPPAGSK